MRQLIITSDKTVSAIVDDNLEIKVGDIVVDPLNHLSKVRHVFKKDKSVRFEDGNGTHQRSCKKVIALKINDIEIPI